mmetsp:Transcript_1500/g.2393  ORF Transcript_1500/g.2393 Transcript_1500/m.2393 type:complete len:207 (-) Transcript_1500:4956-5576(-)
MMRTPDCPRRISEKFINQVSINSLLIVNVTCSHHVSQDTMNSFQYRIRLRILDRSGLTLDGISLQKHSKILLELRTIITDDLDRSRIPTQPSFVEELGDARRSPVKDLIFYNLNLSRLALKLTVNRYSGKLNHLKPTRRWIDHSHTHKLFARAVATFDLIRTTKINAHSVPRSKHCLFRWKFSILSLTLLPQLTSMTTLRELLNSI